MKYKKLIIFMPSIEGGGVEKNLFIVSNFLSMKLKKVSVISTSKKYFKKFNNKIEFISPKNNIWDQFSRRVKYMVCLLMLIKEILKNRNSVVFSFQANIYCILICKIFFVRVIVRSNSSPDGWSKSYIKKNLYKIILKKADKVMVNSIDFKKKIKKHFDVNAIYIYNPLNKKEIIKKSFFKCKKIFPRTKSLKIINVGRFVDQKGQMTILKALNELNKKINFHAVLVGRGILKEDFLRYIKEKNLEKKIKLIKYTDNPFKLIKQADIFVLSSKFEGLPNVLLEATVLKKFIISSNCPTGPREILLNGRGGLLFKTGNHIDLSKKILFYKMNKKKCNIMLRKTYKELWRFDYKYNLEKYYNLIKNFN